MIDLIYNMPSLLLFLLICSISIIFSVFSLIAIDKLVPISFRTHENEGLVIISAIVGIIYAMLVGFTVLYELENFDKAERAEKNEAKIIFAIHREAGNLPQLASAKVRDQIKQYAHIVIDQEWPAMVYGKPITENGDIIIKSIYKDITGINAPSVEQQKAIDAIATDNNELFQIHEERTESPNAALTSNLWLVLILGSLLTLSINFLIGMEFHMHVICVTVIALMVSAVFYLIVTLDQPYRSDFSVSPKTITTTLKFLDAGNMN